MILHLVEFFVNDKTNGNYEFIYYEYRKKKRIRVKISRHSINTSLVVVQVVQGLLILSLDGISLELEGGSQ